MRVLILFVLLTGCTLLSDLDGERCDNNTDCGKGRTCSANHYCLRPDSSEAPPEPECSDTKPCAGTDLCVGGQCEAGETDPWGCVNDRPEQAMPGSGTVVLTMLVLRRDGSDAVPIGSEVTVVACELPTCDKSEGPFKADKSGEVKVVVKQGFKGFVKFSTAGLLDTYYQLQSPINADRSAPLKVTMLGEADVSGLAFLAGVQVSTADRGIVLFQILDCLGERAEDVTVTLVSEDPGAVLFYLGANDLPQPSAVATSSAGIAGLAGVRPGFPQFDLSRHSTGEPIDSVGVAALQGSVTYVPYEFGR